MATLSSVVVDAGASKRRYGVFAVQQRLRRRLELTEFVDNGLALAGVAPNADALVCRWLPGFLVDDDRVPADFPFKTRGCRRVVGQFFVVGVLSDRQG